VSTHKDVGLLCGGDTNLQAGKLQLSSRVGGKQQP
jgi:hypothetical protein